MHTHQLDANYLTRRIKVLLVGVGGNGAQMAACLARLDLAMRALGHPFGLHVTAVDDDRVSESNVGRQLYSRADIGQYKSIVTINRLNMFYGLDWHALPDRFEPDSRVIATDLLISCVDSKQARADIHHARGHDLRGAYWLDLGNTESTAQCVLGETGSRYGRRDPAFLLPCVTDLFPSLLDGEPEANAPSCSVRMSLASQGLFVNDIVVRFAAQLLYRLFSTGALDHHGAIINVESGRVAPISVDPEEWRRFGYECDPVKQIEQEAA